MAKKKASKKMKAHVFEVDPKQIVPTNRKKKPTTRTGIVAGIKCDKNVNGCWFWRMLAHNGETLAHSEGYTSREACEQTVHPVADQLGIPCVWALVK